MTGSEHHPTGFQKSKTFCILPWIHVSAEPDGTLKTCCVSLDHIKKSDGSLFNLGKDKVEDIINSEDYIEIRRKMLNGEKVDGCVACYKREENSGLSHRTIYNNGPMYHENLNLFKEGPIEPKVQYYHLPFGNLCNLKCRTCNPKSSIQIEKEVNEINTDYIRSTHFGIPSKIENWYETEMFERNIDLHIDNLKLLWFTGGEPTLIEKSISLLSRLVRENKSKNIVLKINSNITNINKEFYSLIPKFYGVIFFASIDGYMDMQEYLRYPSKWETIDKNLKKLAQIKNIVIRPTPVVQISNLNKLVDLFEYFESYNRKVNKLVFCLEPIILEYPKIFDINYLPTEYKKDCFAKLAKWYTEKCKFQNREFRDKIVAIKNKCNNEKYDKEMLLKFKTFNDTIDSHRKHYLKDVNPELYNILENL